MATIRSRIGRFVSLLAAILLVAAYVQASEPARAALSFTVNTFDDAPDARPGDGRCRTSASSGRACTLRAAVQQTNASAGADVIALKPGTYVLTIPPGTNDPGTGDLDIRDDVTIQGAGSSFDSTIILQRAESRVVEIGQDGAGNVDVTMTGLGIWGGGALDLPGGGMYVHRGATVGLDRVAVRANEGAGFGWGGGIYVDESATVVLDRADVSANKVQQSGGGIANFGTLAMTRSTVHGNHTVGSLGGVVRGGGIHNAGELFVDQSTLSGNTASRGGGLSNHGFVQVGNSTISGNAARLGGGGVLNSGSGEIWVSFSTITDNKANEDRENRPFSWGGGIANFDPATMIMGNTILAGNTNNVDGSTGAYSPDCYSGGTLLSERDNVVGIFDHLGSENHPYQAHCNLVDVVTGEPTRQFDYLGSNERPYDPGLGPLASYGGPTRTHALFPPPPDSESFVLDQDLFVGSDNGYFGCPAVDQRGVARPQDAFTDGRVVCDLGAYELQHPPNDDFSAARLLTGRNVTRSSDTNVGAARETGEPHHAGNPGGASVWYRWTPSTSGTVLVDTLGSDFDTLLGVYTGSAVDALTEVVSDDFGGGSVRFRANAGTTYRLAVDGAAPAHGSHPEVGKVVLRLLQPWVQETAPGVQLTSWRGLAHPAASGGTYRVSRKAGATAAFDFTGRSVEWVTRRGPDAGKARVLIDGVNKGTFDLYRANAQWGVRQRFDGLADRAHTVVVETLGAKAPRAAAAKVAVDGFVVGPVLTQDDFVGITYGKWAGSKKAKASRGAYRSSAAPASIAFTFRGRGVDWISAKGPGYGKAEVTLDGRASSRVVVDLYRKTQRWKAIGRSFTGLQSGVHTLVVNVLGKKRPASSGTRVVMDAFRLHP